MNLYRMLQQRAAERRPLKVGLIGAGKFGSMYLSQAKHTPGIHIVGIADLAPERAQSARAHGLGTRALPPALRRCREDRRDVRADDAQALIAAPRVDIVIDATGSPAAGIRRPRMLHARQTSSWSTSRPMRSPARCSCAAHAQRVSSTPSRTATSRR
jgi:predicted homoserine dehydrogenase-like protein